MIIFIGLIALGFAAVLIFHFATQGRTLTGTATVVSRRLELSSLGSKWADNYNRLITFRLKDGSEIELYTVREDYETITDGQTGQITWEKENLLHFDPDIP